ncbi:MAG: hypothetical protein GTO42_01310 [Candidatus Latescibacteria bacterium]|nr:hypothetical protein [Candidatus Latescibacterota bacterium]NIO27167.1 hypothetical protein [Candidatus Latescibacterota bacterium]NIO54691.1 hypothetical protein [Candidatus Latescibacterota bacterium]NIT00774.1 hypothetical protein [Candidatus Latescibacterota bacterium]NIT37697.1 hypothetical protein [Candidatus Latescibacterota bacterium]
MKKIVAAVCTVIIVVGMLSYFVYRPWQMTWGATDEEVNRAMVGDRVVDQPSFIATRAVTINASPERIWPWIIQIGYKRAGFYSWDFLDNDGISSAEQIIPDYQGLQQGDRIPLSKDSNAIVGALETNEYLLLIFEPDSLATWVWGLYQEEAGVTRMVTRLRVRTESVLSKFMLDYFEIIMMRKHMLGIKRRAESIGDL